MDKSSIGTGQTKLFMLLEELETNDQLEVPDEIFILPPENANDCITDEDSGEEDDVTLDNLDGNQLRVDVDVLVEDSESDDDLPLSNISKRFRYSTSTVSHTSRNTIVSKKQQYKWSMEDISISSQQWKEIQGPHNNESPTKLFEKLFDDEIFELLVKYSNLYAFQKNMTGDITINEMKCFIGILLFSGYVRVPRRRMYWENTTDAGMKIVYNAIARDRFTFIMKHLHCNDNNNLTQDDKYSKVRPLMNCLNEKFLKYAPVEENHSVDEAMVPYYGRHSGKQFIRGKPIRWGYKFWVGTLRLGYVNWFEPYQGASTIISEKYKELGLGASVILEYSDVLLKHFECNYTFHLYFDNFFTSIPLMHNLSNRGINATGTIRGNRNSGCSLLDSKQLQKKARGTFVYKSTKENILLCKWNDNNVVAISSNANSIHPVQKVQRFSKQQKRKINIDQPYLIKKYNENMGGVDRCDQNISLYRTSIRGKKWYFPLITHCVDMAVQNAWQLYRKADGKMDHLSFRRNITQGLLESYKKDTKRRPIKTPISLHSCSRYDNIGHLVVYKSIQTRCKICHKNANFQCRKCDVALHPKHCFENYHTNM